MKWRDYNSIYSSGDNMKSFFIITEIQEEEIIAETE